MKIKMLSRNPDDYLRETKYDVHKLFRNYNPVMHPFQLQREYSRALNATKLERVFAKPFLAALSGHTDGVYKMCKHPTSLTTLISGSGDGDVIFWNLATREKMRMFQAHTGMVNGISCSKDGQIVTTIGADSTLKHWKIHRGVLNRSTMNAEQNWDLDEKEEPIFMTSHGLYFTCVHHQQAKDNSGLFATSAGHVVEVWDSTRAHPTSSFNWDVSQQHHVRFSGSEPNLMSSLDWDHNILLYDIRRNYPVKKIRMKLNCNSLSWNPMEAYVFTVASDDFNLYTFDLRRTDKAMYLHKDHVMAVMDVDYSPTGLEFVSASFDKTVRIYKCDQPRSREIYHSKRMERLHCVQWSLDDRYIISGSGEMNLRLWKARAAERLSVIRHKQRNFAEYEDKLMQKFQNHPQIRRIAKHRQIPKIVLYHSRQFKIIRQAQRRKEDNIRAHSKPGTVPTVSSRRKCLDIEDND